MGEIKVGTSSWADRSLLASGWYPRSANTPAGRLAYYAERFGLVEVDTTHYAVPAPETTSAWVDRTPPDFTFNVKAFGLFTGHGAELAALPRDLRPDGRDTGRVRRRDLPESIYDELWQRFREAVEPIAGAGKLGVLLFQFPPWLGHGDRAKERIRDAAERCRPWRVAVELRHASWFDGDNAPDTVGFLARHDITMVSVDMPQGHESSIPPLLLATAEPAVMRFHGHSPEWTTGDKEARFRYAYGDDELADWAKRLRGLADETDELHLLLNNCCAGQAQRDAASLAALLGPEADWPGRYARRRAALRVVR
ncbi:DUF72 domain-containing protein [Plantactinospora sp. KLBMP9567]|uniref:DUF72 domain-containing protein n=1 Tax=Plantactinospora sp. KLBMP9567 TaxID=3085900 RepID=UPI002980E0F6|nr:DUF72 domain-containing protein [Plantactinospora sp. KLBMP9567]MDW5327500.1 DUF72 domain-containing protein [Plantactinospora sp. KLBMP9567]